MEINILLKIKDVEVKLTDEELGELYFQIKRLMGRTEYIPYPLTLRFCLMNLMLIDLILL